MSNISTLNTVYVLQVTHKLRFDLSEFIFTGLLKAGLIEVYKQRTTETISDGGLQVTIIKKFVKLRYKINQLCSVFVPKDPEGEIKIKLLPEYQEPIAPSWYVCPLGQLIKQFGQEA